MRQILPVTQENSTYTFVTAVSAKKNADAVIDVVCAAGDVQYEMFSNVKEGVSVQRQYATSSYNE